ncbi:YdbC family protein [Mycoplasmopsis primatum]|uniref:YdbC family protein n=1 Tax=Mycoplasmopsis primatum TaxID=55604 RepID=UPI000495229E|nr:PC4/YdbC family ssDNA-binding protein [Mycoplasmopsis primatum]
MAYKRPQISNEIVRHIGEISTTVGGYKKELNLISWNGGDAKYDIRDWNSDHSRSSKGITLSIEELKALKELIDSELSNLK